MDKEKAIKQINLTKQRVNEGSEVFRDQIDFNVLPLVKEDAVVTGLIHEARDAWTSADRLAKNWLDQAKARILKPAKKRLSADLEWNKLKRIFSFAFFKGGLTLRTDLPNHPILQYYTDEGFRDVIDKIASEDLSNVIRVIGMANYAKDEWGVDQHLSPHPIDSNGIADLHTINPAWEAQAKWRLEYMVERGETVRYIFNDQSSINGWFKHWLNQGNNHGWNGKPTYDEHHGWTKWVHAETYAPEECTEERREWYRSTGKYIQNRRSYIIDNILRPFYPYVIWDNNEVDGGATWHGQEADFANSVGLNKQHRITSVRGHEWFHTKNSIPKRWMIEVHGINSVNKWNEMLAFLRSPYVDEHGNVHKPVDADPLASADGLGEAWIKMGKEEVVKIFRAAKHFQGNSEGRWTNMNPKIYEIGAAMRNEIRK